MGIAYGFHQVNARRREFAGACQEVRHFPRQDAEIPPIARWPPPGAGVNFTDILLIAVMGGTMSQTGTGTFDAQ